MELPSSLEEFEGWTDFHLPFRGLKITRHARRFFFHDLEGGETWPMTADGVRSAVRWVPGMTGTALRRWSANQFLTTVNRHLQDPVLGSQTLRVVLDSYGRVCGLPKRGVVLRPSEVLNAVASSVVDASAAAVRSEDGTVDAAVVAGRDPRTGVNVWFRPDGTRRVKLRPWAEGITSNEGLSTCRLNTFTASADVIGVLRREAPAVWAAAEKFGTSVRRLVGVPVESWMVPTQVEHIMRVGNVPARWKDLILEAVMPGVDGSLLGVVRGFGRAAGDERLPLRTADRVRDAAGTQTLRGRCSECGRST